MARRHDKLDVRRHSTGSRVPRKFIIFVEGRNTEPSYFDLLKRNCKVIPVTRKGSGIGSCVKFVKDSMGTYNNMEAAKRAKYSQRWLVFDYDGHGDFAEAIRLARDNGFNVAFSSMCIEYWFLLHFIDHSGEAIPMRGKSHSQAHIDLLNDQIKLYNHSHSQQIEPYDPDEKRVREDFFDLMMAIDPVTHNRRVDNAVKRAKSIHQRRLRDGAEFKESVTTIYELLIQLGVV